MKKVLLIITSSVSISLFASPKIIGSWECSNNISPFKTTINFEPDGKLTGSAIGLAFSGTFAMKGNRQTYKLDGSEATYTNVIKKLTDSELHTSPLGNPSQTDSCIKKSAKKTETTQTSSSGYSDAKCISGNCMNGVGKLEVNDGSIYEGRFREGKFHGNGKLTFSNKIWMESEFEDSVVKKVNKFNKPDGTICEGNWDSTLTGQGTCNLPDGSTYTGDFLNGDIEGKGSLRTIDKKDGYTYKGGFLSNSFHGYGEMVFNNGDSYKGDFKDGVFSGKGVYIRADKSKYVGDWENGNKHGIGIQFNPDGRVEFKGKWTNDEHE